MSVKNRKAPAIETSANPVFDVKRSPLRAFAIDERANQKLLEGISDAAWRTPRPGGKGRTIAGIASHIHNVRSMSLAAADKSANLPAKLESGKASRDLVMGLCARAPS